MTISSQEDLEKLRTIGRLVAQTLEAMGKALEPGMTTRELDDIGRRLLEAQGARPAPELAYGFPGATCISVGPDVAHGIPGDQRICAGDLVNIDVSAELDGYFGDTGASFAVPPVTRRGERLCRDGRRAMWSGIRAVRPGAPLNAIGRSIEGFAQKNGYSLIRAQDIGWPEIHAFQDELRRGQGVREDGGGFVARCIMALFRRKSDPVETYQQAASALLRKVAEKDDTP